MKNTTTKIQIKHKPCALNKIYKIQIASNVALSNIVFSPLLRHGEKWDNFRAQVQHVMLQPSTARKYIMPLNEIANDFMDRYVSTHSFSYRHFHSPHIRILVFLFICVFLGSLLFKFSKFSLLHLFTFCNALLSLIQRLLLFCVIVIIVISLMFC